LVLDCLPAFATYSNRRSPPTNAGAKRASSVGHLQKAYTQHLERCLLLEFTDLDILLEKGQIADDRTALRQAVDAVVALVGSGTSRSDHLTHSGLRLVKIEPSQPNSVNRAMRLLDTHLDQGAKPYITYMAKSEDPLADKFSAFSRYCRDRWIEQIGDSFRYIWSFVANQSQFLRYA
jgi:hypothetical protein